MVVIQFAVKKSASGNSQENGSTMQMCSAVRQLVTSLSFDYVVADQAELPFSKSFFIVLISRLPASSGKRSCTTNHWSTYYVQPNRMLFSMYMPTRNVGTLTTNNYCNNEWNSWKKIWLTVTYWCNYCITTHVNVTQLPPPCHLHHLHQPLVCPYRFYFVIIAKAKKFTK